VHEKTCYWYQLEGISCVQKFVGLDVL